MVFKCDKCSYTNRLNSRVQSHIRIVHTDLQPWHCSFPGCNSRFKAKQRLTRHRRIHETHLELRKPFPCTFVNCDYRAPRRDTLAEHVRVKHTPGRVRTFKCSLCPWQSYDKTSLDVHIGSHVREKRFKCKHCKFATHNATSLSFHMKAKHEKAVYVHCRFPGCDFSTVYPDYIMRHRRVHDPDKRRPPRTLIPCDFPECIHQASCTKDLKRHIWGRHNASRTKDFTCPLCSKSFYDEYGRRKHIRGVHTNEKHFVCSRCSFATPYFANVRMHFQRVHEGVIPEKFKCDLCDYRSQTDKDMDVHRSAAHSAGSKFQCGNLNCDFKTNEAWNFKQHVLIHEENPLKRFPHACSFPGCDFRRRLFAEMKRHEERHRSNKELEYKCKLCPNRSYPDSVSLRFHKDMIHNTKFFKCSVCSVCVSNKRNLRVHMRKLHNKSDSSADQEVVPRKRAVIRGQGDPTRCSQMNCNNNSGNVVSSTGGSNDGGSASLRNFACDRILIVVLDKINIERL